MARVSETENRIRFDEVLVTDALAWTLFGLAQREGLLYTAGGEGSSGRHAKPKDCQAALSLLVLFDKLVVHDLSPPANGCRLPDLESAGILEVVTAGEPSAKPPPLKSSWTPNKVDPRPSPPVFLRRDLALLQRYKPLIIDRLMTANLEFDSHMARTLHISRRAYHNAFLDLAIHYAMGNLEALRDNIIERALPRRLLNEFKREFFDFERHGETLAPTNAILAISLVFANELATIQELSATRGLGVATRHYTRIGQLSRQHDGGFSLNPSEAPRSFGLVRSILHEEGHFFPRIESIAHALKLRKNPHLRAFKEQFREFHLQLSRGDHDALQKIRNEVRRAKRALERKAKWTLALHWLTYIALPISGVECLLGGSPIVGTSLAVMKAAGTAINARASRKNRWVMFGL